MKGLKEKLVIVFTILPSATFASGGELIPWMGIELLIFIGFLITLFLVKLNWIGKILMIVVFALTEFLMLRQMGEILYSGNSFKINSISFFTPILTTLLSYLAFKNRFKKNKN